jgi:hypothetical protein
MNKPYRLVLILAALLMAVSSCVPGILQGRVSTVSLMPVQSGATFTLATTDLPSITDRKLGEVVAAHLEGLGFRRVESYDDAQYAVGFSYDVGNGVTTVRSGVSTPGYGTATHMGGGMYSVNMTGGGSRVSSATDYPRYLTVMIVDIGASRAADKIVIAWQGEVRSNGSISDMGRVGPTFIDQIFQNYEQPVDSKAFLVPGAW